MLTDNEKSLIQGFRNNCQQKFMDKILVKYNK